MIFHLELSQTDLAFGFFDFVFSGENPGLNAFLMHILHAPCALAYFNQGLGGRWAFKANAAGVLGVVELGLIKISIRIHLGHLLGDVFVSNLKNLSLPGNSSSIWPGYTGLSWEEDL